MFRYLLFECTHYYPAGGMDDCVLKTNDITELDAYVRKNCTNAIGVNFHYYDVAVNKVYDAVLNSYEGKDGFPRIKFVKWEEQK